MSWLARYLQQVYVVHSPRLGERRVRLAESLAKHAIEATWIEICEPRQIGLGLLIRRWRKLSLRLAELSVYLKHEAIFQDIVARRLDAALVLEDDAILEDDFTDRLAEYLAKLPSDAELVFFGGSCGARLPASEQCPFARADRSRSASGYLITGRCARILCGQLHRIDRPIDLKMDLIIQAHGLACYWSEPPLIDNGSEQGIFSHSLGVPWRQR